jgi:hypothetical protein
LDTNIDRAIGSTGKWAEEEEVKLKDAVQTHGDKDWVALSLLVPGRSKSQCHIVDGIVSWIPVDIRVIEWKEKTSS